MENLDQTTFNILDEDFDHMFEPETSLPTGDFDKNWDELDFEQWKFNN